MVGLRLTAFRVSVAVLCGYASLLLLGCSTTPSDAEFSSILQETKNLALEDVRLHHACDDDEEVDEARDYQKQKLCEICRQGQHYQPVSYKEDGIRIETCSACGDHGIVVDLSPELQKERCAQIPALESQKSAVQQRFDSFGLHPSWSQGFGLVRQSAEDSWQCTAGNAGRCQAPEQDERNRASATQSSPVVIEHSAPVYSSPPLPGPPVITHCTNFGSTMNCITH